MDQHGNINYYCMVNVDSFNIHNTTVKDCYNLNNVPVTRSSFAFCFFRHLTLILPFCYQKLRRIIVSMSEYRSPQQPAWRSLVYQRSIFVVRVYTDCHQLVLETEDYFDKFSSHIKILLDEIKQAAHIFVFQHMIAFAHPFICLMQNYKDKSINFCCSPPQRWSFSFFKLK